MPNNVYDVTMGLCAESVVYPGDPSLVVEPISTIGKGCCFQLSKISMSNHLGTHIDFPAHVIEGEKTSDDYDLAYLSGPGQVISVDDNINVISKAFVQELEVQEGEIIFFKTANQHISKKGPISKNYVSILPEAAECLVKKGVKIVGIDYISVDSIDAALLPTHNALLKEGVLIVENLELKGVPDGHYDIQIAPLKISGMDGLPARVMLKGIKNTSDHK